jgi:hypothetical protein
MCPLIDGSANLYMLHTPANLAVLHFEFGRYAGIFIQIPNLNVPTHFEMLVVIVILAPHASLNSTIIGKLLLAGNWRVTALLRGDALVIYT